MTIQQLGNSPLIGVASYNGCYVVDSKGLTGEKCNTDSVSNPLISASDFHRRNINHGCFADRWHA